MKRIVFKIIVRLLFISAWFVIGFFPYSDAAMGLFSAICALITMEICYLVDKKTSGIEKILSRLNYLDETAIESQKTEKQILNDIMIQSENLTGDSELSKGIKEGLLAARNIVKSRFEEVHETLANKKEQL